jgi:sugar/nucleoside kinase (ribokinase family)
VAGGSCARRRAPAGEDNVSSVSTGAVSSDAAAPRPPRGVLCVGEPIADLICEQPVEGLAQARSFVPHFGGTVANVALLAARAGARVALGGAAGDDAWGAWLSGQLDEAGVDVARLYRVPGESTRIALVTVDHDGEASYWRYGEAADRLARALAPDLDEAIADCAGLLLGSDTLVSEEDRALTMRARELALASDRQVVFDPNLRLHRWRSRADAAASANACVPGAMLVCANLAEAQLLTGEEHLERAAQALLKAGARNVVITLGAGGAILRGKLRLDVPGVAAEVLSTIGAGDVVTASLLARLESSDWYEPVIAAGLRDAVIAGARACERWGAVD